MSKITAYTALASPAFDDVVPIVDVHDTTMAATGTTKKITVGALAGVILSPSGDTSGATDDVNFAAAVAALPNGGVIFPRPGSFYTRSATGWNIPAQTTTGTSGGNPVSIQGPGPSCTLFPVGAAVTGVYCHRTSGYGAQFGLPAQKNASFIRDFCIDGTNATGASVGLDIGDGWGFDVSNLDIVNFTGTGAWGIQHLNRLFWSEKNRIQAHLKNNTSAVRIGSTTAPSNTSHEYCDWDFTIFTNTNQNGMVFDACGTGGSRLWIKGNTSLTSSTTAGAPTGNAAVLSLINGGSIGNSELQLRMEPNSGNGTGTVQPFNIYCDGNSGSYIKGCMGRINGGQAAGNTLTASTMGGQQFGFRGMIYLDTGLSLLRPTSSGGTSTSNPSVPSSGTAFNNSAGDQMVYVTGGTVTAITANGTATGQTSGAFFIPSGGSITLTYSAAPSWTWVPSSNSQT